MMKEIVADLYLKPRPTPKHRAYPLDGHPTNVRPENLAWRIIFQAPPYANTVTATNSDRTDACRVSEVLERFNRTRSAMEDRGARRLKTDMRLWVTPDGLIYWIDHNTGARSLLRSAGGHLHIPGGFMDAHGRTVFSRSSKGITAGNVVFDAFPELTAEAAKYPNDPNPPMRTAYQSTYPLDGDPDNTRPSNLILMETPSIRRLFQFL
jgi:hypothetical protein